MLRYLSETMFHARRFPRRSLPGYGFLKNQAVEFSIRLTQTW